ncbi:uncharacterized protein LOC119188793 [Manduca sexta]|uniref:uncharacterized protein LOC119188793 n=1 Tax=Manduca sexta TaxID=7130 RepID=UPI00188ECE46|nr:uncharacterized protein LOC119188793 [Manduca sexta]
MKSRPKSERGVLGQTLTQHPAWLADGAQSRAPDLWRSRRQRRSHSGSGSGAGSGIRPPRAAGQRLRASLPRKRGGSHSASRGAKVKGRALKEARDSGKLAEEGGTRSPHDLKRPRRKRAKFEEVVMAAIASVRQKKLRSSKEKAAQEAAASIMAAAAATFLESEPESGNEGMRADIARLTTEVERLSRENAELKSSRASALVQSSRPVETPPEVSAVQPADRQQLLSLIREGIRQEIGALSARFAVLEGIVLRPPLAGSKKAASYAAAAAPQPTPGTSGPTSQSSGPSTRPTKPSSSSPPPPPPASQRTLAADKPKKAKAARRAAKPAELAETAPHLLSCLLMMPAGQWWGPKRDPTHGAAEGAAAARQGESVANMLRAPKSAAVVVTLQPEAVKKGVTYADLLSKAKGSVSLRISGLDDSVTVEEVVAAIVRTTGCSAEELKPGALRPDYAGMLAITVSCPVTAAKVVAEGRRLLVGWVSAQVKLLEPQPLRCYRCQTGHHVGANINHCARAQDLLLQSMARWSINIAVVSEPYFVPPRNDWVEDLSGSVAIIASAAAGTLTHERVKRGQGCVAARFGGIVVVGCYFSPSRTLAEFHNSLRELSDVVVEYGSLPVVVLGDFNAKSQAWGSRYTDLDRELLLEASIVQSWVQAPVRPDDVNNEADWFREAMSSVCDSAMPRVRRSQARRKVYWWSRELASLQAACYAARRRYTRYRQIRIRPVDAVAREAELYQGYRDAKTLSRARF